MPATPEKNPLAAPQQKPVEMEGQAGAAKGNEVAQVKQGLSKLMQTSGVQPQTIIQLGDLAMAAIKDKALYPMFKQMVVQSGVADPGDVGPNIDYRMLSYFVMASKLLKGQA